jgi:hypothetical protein
VLTAHGGPPKIAQNGTPFPFSDWWTLLVVIEKCCRGAAAMSTRTVSMATFALRQNNPPSALATLLQHRAARARESQAQHWLTPLDPPVLTRISNGSARGKQCCGTGALMVQPVTSQAAPAV